MIEASLIKISLGAGNKTAGAIPAIRSPSETEHASISGYKPNRYLPQFNLIKEQLLSKANARIQH